VIQQRWSSQGLRVLLLTYRIIDHAALEATMSEQRGDLTELVNDLCIVGFVGIMDPPRAETAGVVETCHKAGVRVFMVTGDNPITAASIARRVGIVHSTTVHNANDIFSHAHMEVEDHNDHHEESKSLWSRIRHRAPTHDPQEDPLVEAAVLLTGNDLDKFESHHWNLVERYREVVFARTTPDQKYDIVKNLKKRGNIVAVTGDGVNDAPALKNAHIGVAMGGGSDAAIEAAAMVLLDANFSSIVFALRQGRTVFDNMKKVLSFFPLSPSLVPYANSFLFVCLFLSFPQVCMYLLPAGSFSELTPVLTNIFLGVPLPLSSFLMMYNAFFFLFLLFYNIFLVFQYHCRRH